MIILLIDKGVYALLDKILETDAASDQDVEAGDLAIRHSLQHFSIIAVVCARIYHALVR